MPPAVRLLMRVALRLLCAAVEILLEPAAFCRSRPSAVGAVRRAEGLLGVARALRTVRVIGRLLRAVDEGVREAEEEEPAVAQVGGGGVFPLELLLLLLSLAASSLRSPPAASPSSPAPSRVFLNVLFSSSLLSAKRLSTRASKSVYMNLLSRSTKGESPTDM